MVPSTLRGRGDVYSSLRGIADSVINPKREGGRVALSTFRVREDCDINAKRVGLLVKSIGGWCRRQERVQVV